VIFQDSVAHIAEFPSAPDRARIARVADLRLLWQAEHEEIFARISNGLSQDQREFLRRFWAGLDFVPVNLLGLLSRDNAEAMALEPSEISAEEHQDAVDDIRDVSDWDRLLLDAIEEGSALGEICIKAYEDEAGIHLDTVPTDMVLRGEDYFAEYAELNADPRKTIAPFIARLVHVNDAWYCVLEIHEPGAVIYRAYEYSSEMAMDTPSLASKGSLGREVDLSVVGVNAVDYDTGIDEPTLLVVKNENDPIGIKRGKSDYTADLIEIQRQFDEKLSVLLRHFRELVSAGITILPTECKSEILRVDRRRTTGAMGTSTDFGRRAQGNEMPALSADAMTVLFADATNAEVARHISRDAQYEGGLRSLQIVLSCFERISGMTLDQLIESRAAPESGRAMRLSRMRDRKRIMRKHQRYERSLARAFEIALMLAGIDERVSYGFPDPFPMTEDEKAEIVAVRTGSPSLSTETALQLYYQHTEDEAAAEVGKMRQQQHVAGGNVGMGAFRDVPRPPVTTTVGEE
jgi:hypothetical protein